MNTLQYERVFMRPTHFFIVNIKGIKCFSECRVNSIVQYSVLVFYTRERDLYDYSVLQSALPSSLMCYSRSKNN